MCLQSAPAGCRDPEMLRGHPHAMLLAGLSLPHSALRADDDFDSFSLIADDAQSMPLVGVLSN